MALLSLDNPREGNATSPWNDVVIKEGCVEAEEADRERDDIDFEGGRDAIVALWYNVVIEEGGAEAEEADWGRDDINIKGDSNNLGRGEEETALTDGTMDPGGDVGADDSSTDEEDEIGLIFELEGKETKVCLRDFGSYVKFSKECYHNGYKSDSVSTYLSAQLFSEPTEKRRQVQNDVAIFETGLIEGEIYSSMLKKSSEAIQRG